MSYFRNTIGGGEYLQLNQDIEWTKKLGNLQWDLSRVIYGHSNFPSTRYVSISFGSGGKIAHDPLRGIVQLHFFRKILGFKTFSASNAPFQIFLEFWKVESMLGEGLRLSCKFDTFRKVFRTPLLNRPENGLLKCRILLSTRYLAIFQVKHQLCRDLFQKSLVLRPFSVPKAPFQKIPQGG